jgi:hypothetical protein
LASEFRTTFAFSKILWALKSTSRIPKLFKACTLISLAFELEDDVRVTRTDAVEAVIPAPGSTLPGRGCGEFMQLAGYDSINPR